MRYFYSVPLFSLTKVFLPYGIIKATRATCLVLFTGTLEGRFSSFLTTAIQTVSLTAITDTANDDMNMTAATLIKAT